MVIRQLYLLILLSVLALLPLSSFAELSATVDRAIIEQGETLQLTVRSDEETPVLNELEESFNVIGTSQSSKISFVNGKMDSVKEWIVTLMPIKEGISIIPAITAGNETTSPIRIRVVKAKTVNADQGADIFLEVTLDTNTAYVQSEVIYTAKLFRAVEIREGSLTEPEINSAVVERMGEDVTYQTTRNNRRYQVTERKFALFPQKSGSLAIPPTLFEGQVLSTRQPGRANDPFDRFFQQQRTRRVQIKSDALAIDVLPQPADFSGDNWLPAKRLILLESWSIEPPQFKVGEPITRTLKIQAVGQTGAQLPEFKEYPTNGIKQYKDQPKVETGLSDGSLVGVREEKFAIIPTQSGKLVLPEVKLVWWDTELDKEQVMTIAPRIIDVARAPQAANQAPEVKKDTSTAEERKPETEATPTRVIEEAGLWPYIALGLGVAWILTLITWFFQYKKPKTVIVSDGSAIEEIASSLKEHKNRLKKACVANNPNEAKSAVLAWAKVAWPDSRTHSLISVGEHLQDSSVLHAVIELDEILYSSVDINWNGAKFWSDVGERLKKPRQNQTGRIKSLPSLYPQ